MSRSPPAPPAAPRVPFSLLACPAWVRLAGAAAVSAGLWGMVAWAVSLP